MIQRNLVAIVAVISILFFFGDHLYLEHVAQGFIQSNPECPEGNFALAKNRSTGERVVIDVMAGRRINSTCVRIEDDGSATYMSSRALRQFSGSFGWRFFAWGLVNGDTYSALSWKVRPIEDFREATGVRLDPVNPTGFVITVVLLFFAFVFRRIRGRKNSGDRQTV